MSEKLQNIIKLAEQRSQWVTEKINYNYLFDEAEGPFTVRGSNWRQRCSFRNQHNPRFGIILRRFNLRAEEGNGFGLRGKACCRQMAKNLMGNKSFRRRFIYYRDVDFPSRRLTLNMLQLKLTWAWNWWSGDYMLRCASWNPERSLKIIEGESVKANLHVLKVEQFAAAKNCQNIFLVQNWIRQLDT